MTQEQREAQRAKLLVKANSADVRKKMEDDPQNPDLWYDLGMAVSDEEGPEEGIDIFCQGLIHNPFHPGLYFARGRKNIGLLRYWRCIADTTMAIRLAPEIWNYWYYRAVAKNLNGDYEGAIQDFMECFSRVAPDEVYPLVDWIFLCCLDLGDKQRAKETLELVDHNVVPPQMDYAYRRRVMLYKGVITPEEILDIEHIKANCLKVNNRIELEISTLTFGLYAYYDYIGDQQKADETLRKIAALEPSAAFGYLKGQQLAKKRGLI